MGAYEFAIWRAGLPPPDPIERYRNDPQALPLISQDQWTLDRPLYDIQATNTIVGAESDNFVQAQRRQNFVRRMIPHIFGWFTMMAAWIIIISHLEWARHDLAKISDVTIPPWIDGVIYGTVIIFWSFSFVRITHSQLDTHTRFTSRHSSSSYVSSIVAGPNCVSVFATWLLLGFRAHLLRAQPERQALPRQLFANQCAHAQMCMPSLAVIPHSCTYQVIMVDGGVEQALANGNVPDAIAR